MRKNSLRVCLWASVSAVIGFSATAVAQEDSGSYFEEITVTAAKREQNIYEVPIALSAFDGDNLAAQGITSIADIGNFVPNMNVTSFSAGHVSSVNPFIRGIGLQDHLITTDPGVSVYVDGVYLGRQVGQNWSLSNIERIEVLRGPQGTLYGRNSIGGAVNIITKTPGSFEGARIGMEIGSRGRLNGDFFGDMQLNESTAVSFTGGFKNRDGLGDFVNLPNAGIEVGELQEVYARLALRYAPSDDFSITIAADANDGEGGLRPYTTLIDELGSGFLYDMGFRNSDVGSDPYDNSTTQADQVRVTNEAQGLSITADWSFNDDLSGKVVMSTRSSEYKAGLDDDSLAENLLTFPEVGEADQTSVEFQLNGVYGDLDFVSGLYYFTEDGENVQQDLFFLGGPFQFLLEQDVTSTGIFGNVGYNVSDSLRISGGLRFSNDEKDAAVDIGSGLVKDSVDYDEVSWDLSANFTLDSGMNVYGSVQSGYQSGQYNPRPFCGAAFPDCFINPSENITAINYEIGIKGQPTERLQMSAAIFLTDYSDLPYQVSELIGGGFSTTNLIVDQTSTGFEWESTAILSDNFLFHATLGYIDVDVDRDSATGVQAVAPLTPELTWSISPEFRIPLDSGAEVTLRADYSYRDEMWGEPSDDPGRQSQIESRDLINVNIAYRSPDDTWTAAIYGRNISDERYTNAIINLSDYILVILSNDASEFGFSFTKDF